MGKNIRNIVLVLLCSASIFNAVELEKIKPQNDVTIFKGESVEFILQATDEVGLAYSEWSVNGKKIEKHVVTGKRSKDKFRYDLFKIGKNFVTANVSTILGKSEMLIWKIIVKDMRVIAKVDEIKKDTFEKNVKVPEDDFEGAAYNVGLTSSQSKETNIFSRFELPQFILGLNGGLFSNDLEIFGKSYTEDPLMQLGGEASMKLLSLASQSGIYLNVGYNYNSENGFVVDSELNKTSTESVWQNHKIYAGTEYRYFFNETISLLGKVGGSYYLISEEKKYDEIIEVNENYFGFFGGIGISLKVLSPFSVYVNGQYEHIEVDLKDYGKNNLGGVSGIIGVAINI